MPGLSATAPVCEGGVAYPIKTGVEAEFRLEGPVDKFVVLGMHAEQRLDVRLGVLLR